MYAGEQSKLFATKGLLLGAIALLTANEQTFAQSPGVDPLQPEKRFESLEREQSRSRSAPRLPGELRTNNPGGSNKPQFQTRGFSIVGNRAISTTSIEPLYRSYIGRKLSEKDLSDITAAITALYRANGYNLSRAIVPPQDIKNGVIQIKVIEGSVVDVVVDGDAQDRFGVRAFLAPLTAEMPAHQGRLERQLLLASSLPGVRIADTSLEEIGDASGRFRLTVYVKTWPIYTYVSADNFGSRSVGPWQAYATANFNSYLIPGDSITVNGSTSATDPRQLAFARLGYDAPIGVDGVRVGGSALHSEVRPGDWRRAFGYVTTTQSAELRASVVAVQSQRQTLTLTVAGQATDVTERDVVGTLYRDHVRTLSLAADYRLKDDFGGLNFLTATLRQGLDVLGASQKNDPLLSRFDASGRFAALNLWFTRYQSIADAWSVKLAGAAQFASSELLLSQQFFLGGLAFGRGYGSAEISGDNAVAGTVELRYDVSSTLPLIRGYQLYAFVDSGVAWNVGERYNDGLSLTSAGGGVRVNFNDDLRADLGVAVPLTHRAFENPNRNPRVLFSVSNAFRFCSAQMHSC